MDSYLLWNESQGLVLYGFWLATVCLHVYGFKCWVVNKFYCYVGNKS